MRAVPYSDLCVSSRRSRGYEKPKRAFTGPLVISTPGSSLEYPRYSQEYPNHVTFAPPRGGRPDGAGWLPRRVRTDGRVKLSGKMVRAGYELLWGSSLRVYGEEGAPQGPTRCAPGAPLLGQYCLLWGESPNMTSPVHHQKPPCAYKHSSRQQHYNPPILDSTQFPQLGRTTNNPHPTLSFPIHNPPIPHDVMIQRQSSPGGLEGAS